MSSTELGPTPAPEATQGAPLNSVDMSDISHAQGLERDTQAAFDAGDNVRGDELMVQQEEMVGESIARGSLEGSAFGTSPAVQFLSPDAQFAHALQGMMQVEDQFSEALNSGGYYDLVQPLYDEVITTYRDNAQNKELMKKWRDDLPDEEKIALMDKFQPVTIDPNRVAEARQLLAQIDASLPEGASVFTHPKTREIAGWLNREASPEAPGYLQSGEQGAELGVGGTAAQAVLEFGVGGLDFGLNLAYGSAELADYYISALTGGEQGQYWQRPTSVIRGADGKVHTNAGRVSPSLDFFSTTYALATGQDVEQVVADTNAAREWEIANRNGFENVLLGAAHIAGMGVGFGLPGGAAMGAGARAGTSITQKGLNFLGTLGKSGKFKGAAALAASERATKIVKIMGGVAGAGVANGLMEGVAYGDHEGYSKAFWHGAEMAPILMVLGALGRRTESLARGKMPKKVAEMVGAAVEGAGFGVLEINDMSPLWKFVQDPSEANWGEWTQVIAKNMIGVMAMKAGARTTPGREALEPGRAQAREQAARRVTEEGTAPEVRESVLREADAMGVSRETLTELGQVSREREALKGANPAESKRLAKRQAELELELDRQELGAGESDLGRQESARKKLKKADEAQAAGDEVESDRLRRVVSGLKQVGQKLQTRGRLEQALEQKGREVPQEGMLGPGKDPISRLMRMQQRREGAREITAATAAEVGLAIGREGQVVVRGERTERGPRLSSEKMQERLGEEAKDTIAVHTHPKPNTFSLGDMAMSLRKAGKGKDSPPDFVVTSEGAWEARVKEGAERMTPEQTAEFVEAREKQWTTLRGRTAERVGEGALEAMAKFQRGERLTRKERGMAREMQKARDDFMIASGSALGLTIRRVSPKEAMASIRKHQKTKEAPRDIDTQLETSNRDFPAAGGEEFVEPRTTERVRASDIIREMEGQRATRGIRIPFTNKFLFSREGDPIQLPIRKKGFNKQGIRGYIDQRQDIVRSKEAYDLNNLAHEFAHHMEKKLTGRGWKPTGEALREILDIGEPMYQQSWRQPRKVAEGWAEFWARDLLGDKDLHSQYPTLSRELTQMIMGQPKIAEQYSRLKDAYRIWREQGAGARAQQEIEGGPGAKTTTQEGKQRSLMDKVEDVAGRLVDDATGFKRSWARWMEIGGNKAGDLPISMRPDKLIDAYRMKAAKRAEFLMNTEMTNFAGERTGKSLKDALGKFENTKEEMQFWGYMKRQRELEMMDKGLVAGVDRQEAMAAVSALESPKFREIASDLRSWFHGLIDLVAEGGGLSFEQGSKIKEAYQFYIPFHRMFESPQAGGRTGVSRTSGGVKRTKGGTEPILHPREAIARMATALVSRAQQAHVTRALYNNYVALEGVGGLVTEVARDNVPSTHPLGQIARGLDKLAKETPGDEGQILEGTADLLRDLSEGNFEALTLFQQAQLPKGQRPIVAFTPNHTEVELQRLVDHKRNSGASEGEIDAMVEKIYRDQGELKFLELDKDAYEALAGIENGSASYEWLARLGSLRDPVEKAIRAPTNMLRYFATGISVPFAFRNMIRDAMAHQLYTKNGSWVPLAGFQQFFKGFGEAFRAQRKEFKGDLFTALGGQATTYLGIEIQGGTRAPRVRGDPMSLLEKLRYPFRKVEELIGMTEQALRRREFQMTRKEALDRGATDLEANLEALYDAQEVTTNFTRASSITRQINGVKAYFNAGVQGNRKFVRTVLGYEGGKAQDHAIKAGLANLTATSMLAYLWHGQEDWFKDLPEWRKTGYWNFRPLDEGPIVSIPKPHEPGLMFTLPIEKVLDELMEGNPVSTKTALLEVMGGFLNNYQVLPDVIAPGVEIATNYSMFRKRPIVPHWMERSRSVEDQYTAYTTRAARWIGQAVGVSPAKAEHLISGYTGGGLLQLSRAIDELTGGAGVASQEGFSGFGMLAQKPHKSSRAVDELYALRKEIGQASGSARAGLGIMPTRMRAFRSRVGKGIDSIKDLQRRAREGKLDRDAANEQAFKIADRILNEYREN